MMSPLLHLLLLFSCILSATSITFRCTTRPKCQGMIGYISPNTTTLSSIKDLFGLESVYSLLAANSWPTKDTNRSIAAGSTVRIPFPCSCSNGTGISDRTPVYSVKEGDNLDDIARTIFREFVTYQEIAAVNKISDVNLIDIGQKLWIPLPCSCDDVDAARVVHYGHVVANERWVSQIAGAFGTTEAALMGLNNETLSDPNNLQAGQILDVPIKACNSSMVSSLLVPNGSYALTANNCVQCSCNLNHLGLKCMRAEGVPVTNWAECPSTHCGNLSLGESVDLTTCLHTTCDYAGYYERGILTVLTNQSTCTSRNADAGPHHVNKKIIIAGDGFQGGPQEAAEAGVGRGGSVEVAAAGAGLGAPADGAVAAGDPGGGSSSKGAHVEEAAPPGWRALAWAPAQGRQCRWAPEKMGAQALGAMLMGAQAKGAMGMISKVGHPPCDYPIKAAGACGRREHRGNSPAGVGRAGAAELAGAGRAEAERAPAGVGSAGAAEERVPTGVGSAGQQPPVGVGRAGATAAGALGARAEAARATPGVAAAGAGAGSAACQGARLDEGGQGAIVAGAGAGVQASRGATLGELRGSGEQQRAPDAGAGLGVHVGLAVPGVGLGARVETAARAGIGLSARVETTAGAGAVEAAAAPGVLDAHGELAAPTGAGLGARSSGRVEGVAPVGARARMATSP
ncbi:lysM domain-containing protein [Cinnamomum micranthum f. kanehirae]|uniref:LysM domain-containing protein n=1 Tax=Cinnamomum micranthum f. kanehirae TaxID=337451 RepID=A0A3S3MR01_9MAGN|nr:lysM domain-containing protein [Cinnamomum micranthum f. kanehirae]